MEIEAALTVADHVSVLRDGRIVLEGTSGEVAGQLRELEESYLATGS